jgi:AAA domain
MPNKQTTEDRSRYAQMSKEERLQSFKRMISHPHLQAADQALRQAITETGGASIINVFGPARVGKTTMKNHVMRMLLTDLLPTLQQDRERMPILSISPRPPLSGSFNWKTFFQLGLAALQEPLIEAKIWYPPDDQEEPSSLRSPDLARGRRTHPEGTKDALRHAFEVAVKQRRPVAVIFDEAQHLGKVSGAQLQNQLDCIKSLADETETVFVLIGTYELLPLRNLSAQLIGRSLDIHFPRYRSTKNELAQFKKVLATFQDALPFEAETNVLLENWEFCYERSIGCIGNLRLMLVRAVHAALWQGEKKLRVTHLRQYAFSETECYEMMREAYEGERELTAPSGQRTQFLEMLGLIPQSLAREESPPPSSPNQGQVSTEEPTSASSVVKQGKEPEHHQHIGHTSEPETSSPSGDASKKQNRPFQRKLQRDLVGEAAREV